MDTPYTSRNPALVEELTGRELDVLRLKAQNRSNQEIADELVLALSTVKWYVRQIYGKLGVGNRRQAVARAQALGLIEGPRTPSFRPHHNLPAQTTPFIGRARELDDLEALLADPEMRLITILAPGGMGKTRLGLAVAEAHLDRFMDGVYMVPLAPLQSPDQIVSAIADATGFPFISDQRSPKQQVLDFLRQKHMLLVLDNFEHLLEGAEFISEMLRAAPDVQIVITSRERLNLSGETVYSIGGMIFPDWETPEDALEYDAVKLFLQRAEQVCPDFELHPDTLRYLARICRLVEGMPLGIVLATAWTEVVSLEEIADEIQSSFDFLAAEMRDVPRRQWSIRAVFEPTWNRLTDTERDAFMRFSVFRGGCLRDAAQAVTGADLRTLQVLIIKALVDRDSAGRYQMHELLRQYAEQQLEAAGLTEETYDSHCDYFLSFLREREDDLKGRRQLAALKEIDADFENVQMAWQWAIDHRDIDIRHQVSLSLVLFAHFGSRGNEVRALFRLAQDRSRQLGETLFPGWVQLLACIGGNETLPIFTTELAQQHLAVAYQYGDVGLANCVLCLLRRIHREIEDYSDIFALIDANLAYWQALGEPFEIGLTLLESARHYSELGQQDKSTDMLLHSAEINRVIGNKIGLNPCLDALAVQAAFVTGNYDEGERLLREAIDLSNELENPGSLAGDSTLLAILRLFAGDFDEAQTLAETALAISTDLNYLGTQAASLYGLAMLACIKGDYLSAQQLIEHRNRILKETAIGRPAWVLAIVACGLADYQAARRHLHTFLEWAFDRQVFARLMTAFPIAAIIRGNKGDQQGAAELLGLSFTHPMSATGWMAHWDLLTEFRADLENDLGADAYHTAWERGATLDLETVIAELLEEFTA